jgi:hypothetical protein
MTSAYVYPLIFFPVVIDAPGQYRTRRGEVVTIGTVSTRHDWGCRGLYPSGVPERWHKSGRIFAGQTCDNDIVSNKEVSHGASSVTYWYEPR